MILSLANEEPEHISCKSSSFLQKNLADIASIHMKFKSGIKSDIRVSWVNPLKEVKLVNIDKDNKVDSLIVAVGHDQFRSLSPIELKSFCNGSKPVIADVKSIYNKDDLLAEGLSVFRL